ncbi:hypothetical protein BGW36DRAFT_357558 [Talaromyces proteolyticus]|uniref:Uncharacterized protein n=1 Tax=Talaromyces proteolyticus TaxID=1131652 RepID=A0AAD4KU49_9EURO|nr:uncharacterized protein BGW36DRAFT_357558 [Talaromyces proteolyticus]KAH8700918.1 hypothetical protein BGW36DRAFT_357558 [Talaromyces proteolyticus]
MSTLTSNTARRSACDRCRAHKLRCIREPLPKTSTTATLPADNLLDPYSSSSCRRCLNIDTSVSAGTGIGTGTRSENGWKGPSSGYRAPPDTAPSPADITTLSPFNIAEPFLFDAGLFMDNSDIFEPLTVPGFDGTESSVAPVSVSSLQGTASSSSDACACEYGDAEGRIEHISHTLSTYLAQLSLGPPAITLTTIIFTHPTPTKGECERTDTVDNILKYTTRYVEAIKAVHQSITFRSKNGAQKIDSTMVLRLLTGYVTLIKLYLILFAHVHEFLQDIITDCDEQEDGVGGRKLEGIPGIQILGSDIRTSPSTSTCINNVWADALIITHLIASIEQMLGLRVEYRLDNRQRKTGEMKNGEERLFSDDDEEIVTAVMRKEAASVDPMRGCGGVEVLRATIERVKRLVERLPL